MIVEIDKPNTTDFPFVKVLSTQFKHLWVLGTLVECITNSITIGSSWHFW